MKKFLLMVSLLSSCGQVIGMNCRKKPKNYNPELVSICFPKQTHSGVTPNFQLSKQAEQIIPTIASQLDNKGRINLQTDIEMSTVKTILFAFCKKDVLGLSNTLNTLSPEQFSDISNNVLNPLEIRICSKLPTFYDKQVSISDAVQGGNKEDYFSLIVSNYAGRASWQNRLGMVCLPKQSVNGVIAPQAVSNNIVALNISHDITKEQAQTLVVLVGAYIKAFADTNPATRIQDLKQVCNQVPALLVRNFRNNIAPILNIADTDIIGFENNIIQTGAKSLWNNIRDYIAIGGVILIAWMGINKLRS